MLHIHFSNFQIPPLSGPSWTIIPSSCMCLRSRWIVLWLKPNDLDNVDADIAGLSFIA